MKNVKFDWISNDEIKITTSGRWAMHLAIEVLEMLDQRSEISVKNTGWKNGFGLDVGNWIPITAKNVSAELMTDGSEFNIRKVLGSSVEFQTLVQMVEAHVLGKPTS